MTSVSRSHPSYGPKPSKPVWNAACVAVGPMRTALLVLLATLSGCLFVGDVNQRPSVEVGVDDEGPYVGQSVTLLATAHDDQSGVTTALTVTGKDGAPVDACAVQQAIAPGGWQLRFWKAGPYTVTVTPTDREGAEGSSASTTLTVFEPQPTLPDASLSEGTAATECASWTATAAIPIKLPDPAIDPATSVPFPAHCGFPTTSTLTYAWSLVSQPTSAGTLGLATVTNGASKCPATPISSGLTVDGGTTICLYPDPSVPVATPSTYGISVTVSTDVGTLPPVSIMVPVLGDAPACLDGSYPSAGSYVVPSDEATVFEVVGEDDVSPAGTLVYTWTVTRADGTSTVVQPATDGDDDGARLSLDPTVLGVSVGETLQLRAEVVEPGGIAPSCADSDDTCAVASCVATSSACPTRATWTLEYR
jgi:hypothetical protein